MLTTARGQWPMHLIRVALAKAKVSAARKDAWWKTRKSSYGFAASLALAVYLYWYWRAVERPRLHFKPGPLSKRVIESCSILLQRYYPSPLVFNTYMQTMLGLLRSFTLPSASYDREVLATPDGGCVALDWYRRADKNEQLPATVPVVLVLHGINGSSSEGYCIWMCEAIQKRGWRAVVLNYRGCAGLPLTNPKTYNAATTEDVHLAISEIKKRYPEAPLAAVGYSLGSIVLTKYCAEADREVPDNGSMGVEPAAASHPSLEENGSSSGNGFPAAAEQAAPLPHTGQGSQLVAAVMVSSPFCLATAHNRCNTPFTMPWLFGMALAYRMKLYAKMHWHRFRDELGGSLDAVAESWTLQHVEKSFLLRVAPYRDVEEYYQDASSQYHIPHLRTPSLFLVSQDDPFLGHMPLQQIKSNENTVLATTKRGGHCAFLEGFLFLGQAWVERATCQFLAVLIADNEHAKGSSKPGSPAVTAKGPASATQPRLERSPSGKTLESTHFYFLGSASSAP